MEYGDLKTVQDILLSIREHRIISVDDEVNYRPAYQQEPPVEQANFLQ
jgi:hypothetical protein